MNNITPITSRKLLDKSYFIAWIGFQRRVLSMQNYFNYHIKFISYGNFNRKFKFLDYLLKSVFSTILIIRKQPEVLWIQLPPTPLIQIVLLYKKINRKVILVADCHNGLFAKKWLKHLDVKLLNQFDVILVHNFLMENIAFQAGLDSNKVKVLEDKPANKPKELDLNYDLGITSPWILMPCSFAADEPLKFVFEAAKVIPEISIVISGNHRSSTNLHDLSNLPDNVILTGYLSTAKFDSLCTQANCIMGLTTKENVQLSVANEAVGLEKPMILSDTRLLRDLFSQGAVYVKNAEPNSIAFGIKKALNNIEELTAEVKSLKKARNERWLAQADIVKYKMSSK